MGIRQGIAKATSSILTWGLRTIARRPAGNTPGAVALRIDPHIISELRSRMHDGSIVVVGTNGKTTVTNLLANTLEAQGYSVLCNRTGANLNTGIASALLQSKGADWGVLECDELWSAKVVPQLHPTYFLLLNLFRDQLDRCGEIDHIQDAIVSGLIVSPETILIYNADDPLCEMVAQRVAQERSKARKDGKGAGSPLPIPFGTLEPMGLEQNQVADATMCQRCLHMFDYAYRQYGQLGAYRCSNCGFTRAPLQFAATDIDLTPGNLEFEVTQKDPGTAKTVDTFRVHTKLSGTYMVYNLLAIAAAARSVGVFVENIQRAITAFDPKNGRLQEYCIRGRRTLLNLAKNPTGFNQNLRIIEADHGPKAAAFFINSQVVDGFDVSWIWDIDFEELASQPNLRVFVGGERKNDLQVRLKYAGIRAELIDKIDDVFDRLAEAEAQGDPSALPADAPVYAIANYTALPPVKRRLDKMAEHESSHNRTVPTSDFDDSKSVSLPSTEYAVSTNTPVVIAHFLPDLLNLYGDGGNVRILEQRLKWRGIPVEVKRVHYGETIDLDTVDLAILGGSPDKEQRLASEQLATMRDDLARYVEEEAPLLAICGSYQMLGRVWLLDDEEVPGLDILAIETRRPGTSTDRLIGDIGLKVPFAEHPVIGFENHAGRTYLDEDVEPFGSVASVSGVGNNEDGERKDYADGIRYKGVIGTYLHGPLLSKNPEVADHLLRKALERKARREGTDPIALASLDDTEELEANATIAGNWVE